MQPVSGKRLVVTLSEADHAHGHQTRDRLLALFKHHGLPGAVAYRSVAGYAAQEPMKTTNLVDLSGPLPVRVEVVATNDAIERVLPDVYDLVDHGLVEVQDTQIVKWWAGAAPKTSTKREELVRTTSNGKAMQIQIAEADRWEDEPLYEAIVKRARQIGITGASVYRGIVGYGSHHEIHHHHLVRHDDPILISIIDSAERVDQLLTAIDRMVTDRCLVAISDVDVIRYAPRATIEPRPTSPLPVTLGPEPAWSPETNGGPRRS